MYMRYLRLTRIFLLLLGLAASNTAPAQDIEVISADPKIAVQGTLNLDIEITGKGFDKTVKKVEFLLSCTEVPCSDDTGGIKVNKFKVRGPKKIIANIDISDTAEVADFDIQVSATRGRGGKGTTLFRVQAKKDVYLCSEVFTLSYNNSCDCTFTVQDKTDQKGTPPLLIWAMQSNCTTSETLVIEQFEALSSDTNTNAILTAVAMAEAPFDGSAVIAARGHRANIFNFNIHIDGGVDAGCGEGQLHSAIGFVLDSYSLNTSADSPFRNTRWGVSNSTITSDAPLCHAMEFSRMPDYEPDPDTIEGRVNIHRNVIMADSDNGTGILFRGFGPVNTFLSVSRNTIIDTAAPVANAIQFGPIFGPGTVERNLISLRGGAGVGVLVMGDGATTDVMVNQNEVTGAFIAVLVDDQVADVLLKSNILTGDGDTGTDDIGVCTDAANNAIRANKIKDYNDAVLEDGCTAMASPAD